ncbi:hypothetical protein Tco_0084638 [Tanacetum coccineum]
MAPRGRPTRLNPGTTPPPVTDPTTTTSVTSAQLQAMIDEGVTAVLAARATTRNGDDSHTGSHGTEEFWTLTQWFEKIESVYYMKQPYIKTTTSEAAIAMPWRHLKKKMTDKYTAQGAKLRKLEFEMWNLKDQVKKYSVAYLNTIHGRGMSDYCQKLCGCIEFAPTELMTKRINTWAERQADKIKESHDHYPGKNQSASKQKDINTEELMPLQLVKRKPYGGLNLCVPNSN